MNSTAQPFPDGPTELLLAGSDGCVEEVAQLLAFDARCANDRDDFWRPSDVFIASRLRRRRRCGCHDQAKHGRVRPQGVPQRYA